MLIVRRILVALLFAAVAFTTPSCSRAQTWTTFCRVFSMPGATPAICPNPNTQSAPKVSVTDALVFGDKNPTVVLGCLAANYANIVNGTEWPRSFCPYTAHPFNTALPASPANVDSTNTTALASYAQSDNGGSQLTLQANTGDFSRPVYLAKNTDPLVTISTSSCNITGCSGTQIRIPTIARAAQASDGQMGVIEPDGSEWDFYGAQSYAGGTTISAGAVIHVCDNSNCNGGVGVNSSGIPYNFPATDLGALMGGVIRVTELQDQSIKHALIAIFPCTNGTTVYPAGGGGAGVHCSSGGIPMGSLVYLALTDSQINALGLSTDLTTVAKALAHYGAYVSDTGGNCTGALTCGTGYVEFEDGAQYTNAGGTFIGVAYTTGNAAWSCNTNQCTLAFNALWSNSTVHAALKVLSTCYALGTCSN